MALVADARAKLQKIKLSKSILDDNLEVLQRQNKDAFGVGIQFSNPHINPQLFGNQNMKEIRAKKMVGDVIKALSEEVHKEVESQKSITSKKTKSNPTGKLNYQKFGDAKSSHIPIKKKERKLTKGSYTDQKFKKVVLPTKQNETENYLDHVYGVGPHRAQRQTVFNPYFHVTSPIKEAKYRSKRVLETVNLNRVKSQKCQTENMTSQSSGATKIINHKLQCSAIAIGPPIIMDNKNSPLVVAVEKRSCYLSTESESSLQLSPIPKPSTKIKAPMPSGKPCEDEIPGKELSDHDSDVSNQSLPERIQLTGTKKKHPAFVVCCPDAISRLQAACTCNSSNPIPQPQNPCCHEQTVRVAEKPKPRDQCTEQASDWVEQEVMARILSEIYPSQSRWNVPCKEKEEFKNEEFSERGLPFVIDADFDVPEKTLARLIEEELRGIIRQMIGERCICETPTKLQTFCPAQNIDKNEDLIVNERTPVNTPPNSSPRVIKLKIKRAKTPSLTSHESEAEGTKESTILDEIEPLSSIDSLPCNLTQDIQATQVITPKNTPRQSPEPSTPSNTPPKIFPKSCSSKVLPKFDNPWDGFEFPLPEDTLPHTKQYIPCRPNQPLGDDICDIIVRETTPAPQNASVQVDTSESSFDDVTESRTDQTISEGQLVISHGEIKPKKIPYLNKLMPYCEDDALQATFGEFDATEHNESRSEGEINPKGLSRRIPDLPVHVPSVYARPRKPLPGPSIDVDEISVGEVVDDRKKRERFSKWRDSRLKKSLDETASIGEYRSSSTDAEEILSEEDISKAPGVILVTPADEDISEALPQRNPTLSSQFGQSYQTTGSAIPIDSLEDTGKPMMTFTSELAATNTDSRKNLSFRVPLHEDVNDDVEEISLSDV